jgi:succinate dehydrogenase/fumarate reductase flavoprotein subunit
MFGNEGKTRYVYKLYTQYGFDPDKDMLQANVLPPEYATRAWGGMPIPYWRSTWTQANGGGLMADWNLKTNLEGLYLGGNTIAGAGDPHPRAASTGRYAARIATKYTLTAEEPVVDRKQVEDEKARVYAPVNREDGMGWKELQAGLCRIMQDYCGEHKSEKTLKTGLWYLNSIRESDVSRAYARNPHELMRILECFVRLTVGEIIFHSCLVRKASSKPLNFKRLDYSEIDPPEWNKFLPIRLENGEVKVREVPLKYWLLPPHAPTYEENYKQHCAR